MESNDKEKSSHKDLFYIIAGVLIIAGIIIFQWGMVLILIGVGFIYLVIRTYFSQSSFYATFDPDVRKPHQDDSSIQGAELKECPDCGLEQKTSSKFCKSCGYKFRL